MADWDPAQYRRFEQERSAPFWDLLDLIEVDDAAFGTMVDLGCGDGTLTVACAARFSVADTLGIDSSPAMIGQARLRATPTCRFIEGDLAGWESADGVDLVVANASLQWVSDHPCVLERWVGSLAPGGQLAVQVPANGDHPAHTIADDVARQQPFLDAFSGTPPPNPTLVNVLAPEQYAELLDRLGCDRQHVRLQVYPHRLASSSEVVEWVRGTNLNRFFTHLPDELREPFVDAYRTALIARIGDRSPYFFAFKRILMWARRPAE